MMKLIRFLTRVCVVLLFSLSGSYASIAQDLDVVVIANPLSQLSSLTRSEVRQIYMGGTLSRKYDAVTFPVGDATRIQFNTKVIGLTESRIQSYWAQLLFLAGVSLQESLLMLKLCWITLPLKKMP